MKEIKKYRCEICQSEYLDKQAALDCEKCHHAVNKITEMRYLPKNLGRDGYPVTVSIQFDDGKIVKFKR